MTTNAKASMAFIAKAIQVPPSWCGQWYTQSQLESIKLACTLVRKHRPDYRPNTSTMMVSGTNVSAKSSGKMFKLDTDTGEVDVESIVAKWYSVDNDQFGFDVYRGVSMWHTNSTGTGNMYTAPQYVEDYVLGSVDALLMWRANPVGPCRRNRSSEGLFWRWLERGVYPSSFVIIDKPSLALEAAIPLQGVNVEDATKLPLATYRNSHDEKLHGVAAQKSDHFYVFAVRRVAHPDRSAVFHCISVKVPASALRSEADAEE